MQDEPQQYDISLGDIDNAPQTAERTSTDAPVTERALHSEFVRIAEENAQLRQDLEAAQKKARASEILDDLIEPYAAKAFWFMCAYSATIGLMLLMNAFGCFKNPISADVLQVLVGSTAVTVIGLVGMVLTGIFVGARK